MSGANWLDLMKDAQSTGSFAPLPDGDYDLKVLEAEAKLSGNGKPMYVVKAEVQSGPHAKRLVWDRLVITRDNPNALRYFFRKMGALGLDTAFFEAGPTDNDIVAALMGRNFRAKIGPSTGNSTKPGNEIKEYYPAASAGQVPAPAVYASAPAPAVPSVPAAPAPAPAPAAASPWETAAPAPAPAAPPAPAPGGFAPPPAPPF